MSWQHVRISRFGGPEVLELAEESTIPNPDTGEVAAFEELVGCHGGLGGPQTEPFVLFPAELEIDPAEPIVGAAGLHRVLKSWTPSASQPVGEKIVS